MNALTLPRTVAGYEYKAVRFPAQLIETKLVATKLADDNGVRLAYERFLGSLDTVAGKWLDDADLSERGRLLTRRADVVEKAAELEAKAAERKEAADAALRAETEKAEQEKAAVEAEHEREAARLKAERKAEKEALDRKAAARKKANSKAIVDKTQQIIAAERDRLDAQEAKIEARVKTTTAAPKAQLKAAVEDTQDAAQKKADAARLADLREQEKAAASS